MENRFTYRRHHHQTNDNNNNKPTTGRKRTVEMEEKLKAADKGDLLDFRMDGGMSAQVFEGQDYSKGRHKVGTCFLFFGLGWLCAWVDMWMEREVMGRFFDRSTGTAHEQGAPSPPNPPAL
jgi:hypothetical protein